MNSALLELSPVGEVVPMLGLPTEQPAKRGLAKSVDEVFRSIAAIMDELVLEVLETRTRDEFNRVFREAYPQYVRLLRSFSEITASVPNQVMARLAVESFNDLEQRLRSRGEECFGSAMTERALFTVFSLRKIAPVLYSVLTSNRKLESCDVEKDRDFARNYMIHALVARFSIDCLIVAMDHNRTIYPDVLAALNDHMRAVVDAYAWVRQAAELRTEPQLIDVAATFPPLDADDRQLLKESMSDLARSARIESQT
jgi:hypothetical protein